MNWVNATMEKLEKFENSKFLFDSIEALCLFNSLHDNCTKIAFVLLLIYFIIKYYHFELEPESFIHLLKQIFCHYNYNFDLFLTLNFTLVKWIEYEWLERPFYKWNENSLSNSCDSRGFR